MPSASRVSWAKFRVVVVSGVAVAILLVLFYLLTGGTLLERKAALFLYVPDATGLDKDSPVRVDGIDVGKVEVVELSGESDPNRVVRIIMKVERARLATITIDSIAEIDSDGIVGDKYVGITTKTSPLHIQPNGELKPKPPSDLMSTIDLPQLQQQLQQVDQLLADIQAGRGTMGQFVLGGDVYTELIKSIGRIETAFHAAVSSTTAIGDALYTDRLYRQFMDPLEKADKMLAALQSGQGTGGAILRDPAQYESALKSVRDLEASVAKIRNNEWMQSDQAYRDWNRTVVSYIQQVDRINADPLLNSTATYENLTGMLQDLQHTVKEFRQDPRKFLRLKVF